MTKLRVLTEEMLEEMDRRRREVFGDAEYERMVREMNDAAEERRRRLGKPTVKDRGQ
jgi:hypothetical protein